MNTIFGIGFAELAIIGILVIVLIGPERTQEAAQKAGRALGKLLRSQWWSDFQSIQKNIRDLPNTLVRMAEIEELQEDLKQSLNSIQTNIQSEAQELSEELSSINNQIYEARTILPPQESKPNEQEENHG